METKNTIKNFKYQTKDNSLEKLGGKLPPQAPYLEEAVLGALMLEKHAADKVMDLLNKDIFYSEAHKFIFEACEALYIKGQPIDILTVTQKLKEQGNLQLVGGAYYVSQLTSKVASSANIEHHTHIILQKHIQRELIRVSGEIGNNAYEDSADAFELLDSAEQKLFDIKNKSLKKNYDSIDNLVSKALKQLENVKDQDTESLTGVPTGLRDLDKMTSGWQKSDLIIIAGRPSMGKTAFVLSIARNAAVLYNKPVAIFSLEMSSLQIVNRLISSETEIPQDKLRNANLEDYEWERLIDKAEAISNAPIYIDDSASLTVSDLRSKARRLKTQKNIELIVIDYLQLMHAGENVGKGNREQEISYISRSLKIIAKELEIPVIALAQLSRAVEQRPDKKPILSDLRESGSIEQDADLVSFLYRPEYYKLEFNEDGESLKGLAEIIIAKHRNGSTGSVLARFKNTIARFENRDGFESEDTSDGYNATITRPSRLNEEETPF